MIRKTCRLIKKIIYRIIYYFSFFYNKKIDLSLEESNRILNDYSAKPNGTPNCCNNIGEKKYDLQIVVPVYNEEKYIEKCLKSILEQKTKYSYKVVIINDGSTDSSLKIIQNYSNNKRIEIINQKNKGFSGARNSGIKNINSSYIAFVDADDILEPGAIESLLDTAIKEQADIVQGGYFRLAKGKKYIGKKYKYKSVNPLGKIDGFPWGKVFNSNIFSFLCFPENYWFEDSIFSFLVYTRKYRVFTISNIVYTYRVNYESITHKSKINKKCIDTFYITKLLVEENKKNNLEINSLYYEKIINQIALNFKRTKNVSIRIKKAIFKLTSELLKNNIPHNCVSKKYKRIDRYIRNENWIRYKYFCLSH